MNSPRSSLLVLPRAGHSPRTVGRAAARQRRATTLIALGLALGGAAVAASPSSPRHELELATGWRSVAVETAAALPAGFEQAAFDDSGWTTVEVPHNWDRYEGARPMRHGQRHGTAAYRRTFSVPAAATERRVFLFFEGVGSFATVWVNGREVGRHAGGLTTFTLDVTEAVRCGAENTVVVRADHPAGIRDLPWACAGCELSAGFTEGPQPFGIFRPVSVVTTAPVRIEPFGVHVWNDATATTASATLHTRTEVRNYGAAPATFTLVSRLKTPAGETVTEARSTLSCAAGATQTVPHTLPVARPQLWSPDTPHLYALESELTDATGRVLDRDTTPCGIRTVRWPAAGETDTPLRLNGEPCFLNGTCDYEHNLGNHFAFSSAQIAARVAQIRAAGFNAFRDAHHPHNLRFQQHWDRAGLLWWTQFGDSIWFDRDDFRANFKTLLREWVKERRNSPSLILWGLQNESLLPTAFAEECAALIRELDPTASSQRLITTCNGGTGTDWDVPQNWTGTYGGDPATYADDLRRQRLVGEYGAWRSLAHHTEPPPPPPPPPPPSVGAELAQPAPAPAGPPSEEHQSALLETKIRLAESVRAEVCGHFQWPFTTHANPGRAFGENGEQHFDGIDPLDRIGPANNKGLFTQWGEPTDAFYLYRANFAPAATQPMVYLVSHTWPDRWTEPGRKSGIVAYSNCDEVELFNDLDGESLGIRKRAGRGTHFRWDDVEVRYNVLRAVGRVAATGARITDTIRLADLPPAPRHAQVNAAEPDLLAPTPGFTYLHRVNCGGPDHTDAHGNLWSADHPWSLSECTSVLARDSARESPASRLLQQTHGHPASASVGPGATPASPPLAAQRDSAGGVRNEAAWGFVSWASAYPWLDPRLGSQRRLDVPVSGTNDDTLFRTFRYGRDQLRYRFTVPDGDYTVELFFAEPWYSAGGGLDCRGWRLFDLALNGETVARDLDLAAEAGFATAVKRCFAARARDGRIEISFPRVAAGQAVIAAIAIAQANPARGLSDGEAASASATPSLCLLHSPFSLRPPPAPTQFLDTRATPGLPAAWIAGGHLQVGTRLRAAPDSAVVRLSTRLADADWLVPAAAPVTPLHVTVTKEVEVYAAFPTEAAPAAWLAVPQNLTTADGTTFTLHKRRFTAGSTVEFSSDSTSAPRLVLAVAVRPATACPPRPLGDGRTEWTIAVGVGDRYGLNLSFRNPTAAPVAAVLDIIQADGRTLHAERLEFPPTSAHEWSVLRTRTGSSINAGTYVLRLTPAGPNPIACGPLEVE